MRSAIALGLAISLLFGAESVQGEENLQGTWKLIAGEANGQPLPAEQLQDGKLVIEGDHYTVTLHGMGTSTGEQKLDPTGNLKTIDITPTNSSDKSQTFLGIYELEGDLYRVTFAPSGKARPKTLSTTPDSGNWSHVWKRVTESE